MRNWITRWIASALALLIITQIPQTGVHVAATKNGNSTVTLLIAVVALGLVNAFIRPIIMFFAWPINCLTFGLLGFAINILLFFLVGQVVPGFKVDGVQGALIGSVAMAIISGAINFVLKDRGDRDNR